MGNLKIGDIALLMASAVAVYLVFQAKRGTVTTPSTWKPWQPITTYEGYQYYGDGSSGLVITPQGEYVLDGVVVWSPSPMF